MRARAADSLPRPLVAGAVALVLLALWSWWFAGARISLYETSDTARLEVAPVGNAVDAPVAGRIVAYHLVLGQKVEQGQLLVELDATISEQHLVEARARHAALAPQIESRQNEIRAEEEFQRRQRERTLQAIDKAKAGIDQAEALSALSGEEARRAETLFKSHTISEIEHLRARADERQKGAGLEAARSEIKRLERELETEAGQSTVRISRLKTEMADLLATDETTTAAVHALEREVEEHRIRAQIAGRVAELSPKQIGGFVRRGDHLATVVPAGELRAVAEFKPSSAIGRIQAGQKARLRLEGFPWAQYGWLFASVTRVGNDVHEGRVRVELDIHPDPASAIPLQHGLPGQVEVEVERITPLALVLRVAGRAITRPAAAASAAEGPQT